MSETGTFWLPPASSTFAGDVDGLFYFIYWVCVVSFAILVGATFWFAWHYRKREGGPPVQQLTHSTVLEVAWSVIPGIIMIAMFVWGFKTFVAMNIAPSDSMVVYVTGQKWSWDFTYANGRNVPGELHVPVNKPVKLIMNSKDVIHSFFVPEFRVKMDVIPGRYTTLWFEATTTGEKQVFCTEYCGKDHSAMLAKVVVQTQEEFDAYMDTDPFAGMSLLERGEKIYNENACKGCHSLDGSAIVAPSFKGLWGKEETLADGSTVKVDADYILSSLRDPGSQVVEGFGPIMPVYTEQQVADENVLGLIEYIKSVK